MTRPLVYLPTKIADATSSLVQHSPVASYPFLHPHSLSDFLWSFSQVVLGREYTLTLSLHFSLLSLFPCLAPTFLASCSTGTFEPFYIQICWEIAWAQPCLIDRLNNYGPRHQQPGLIEFQRESSVRVERTNPLR